MTDLGSHRSDRSEPDVAAAPRRWRPLVGVLAACAVAVAVLAVAWSLDRTDPGSKRPRVDPRTITELVEPSPLTEEERSAIGGGGANDLSSPSGVALSEGGWIEVADDAGRLKQRYAASRMDPLPDGWVEMIAPRALVFGKQGQVTSLEGGFGTARLPDQEIEAGTLREDVRIRFYRPMGDRPVSIDEDRPWLEIEADAAEFDGVEGRIRCDGPVSIVSAELEFSGENLLVLLQPDGREVEQLLVERATGPLRLRPGSRRPDAPESGSAVEGGDATAGAEREPRSQGEVAASAVTPVATPARFMQLVLDGGVQVVRTESGRRLTIDGDRLAAIFSMESGGFGSLARASDPAPGAASTALPVSTWLAATAIAAGPEVATEDELVEIEFGGSLLVEPLDPGAPRPSSTEEVWIRIEGQNVLIHEADRDARVRCDLLDLRTGGSDGDRVDLLARKGAVTIDAPGLAMTSPAVRVRGPRVLVAGPGELELEQLRDASEPSPTAEDASTAGDDRDSVHIEWDDRLDLTLSPEEDRLRQALFEGGDSGTVRVRSAALELESGALDVGFLADGSESAGERIDRIAARRSVDARRPGGTSRLQSETLLVQMRQDADEARPARIEARGGVRAFDESRVLWCAALDAVMLPPRPELEEVRGNPTDRVPGEDFELVEARGGVVAGLADGTWVFADGFEARPSGGRLLLVGEDVAISRDGAVLDGLRGLELIDADGDIRATTRGPGRLQAANEPLLAPWAAPTPEAASTWVWPDAPARPAAPADLAVAAVWEGGLRYREGGLAEAPGSEVAILEVSDRVRARAIDQSGTEDRLGAQTLRLGFARSSEAEDSTDRSVADADGGRTSLEIASMDLVGEASLERRRLAPEGEARRPDLLRITGDRIAYVVATGEGRVPGAGVLLVSEAETSNREARTARFKWADRLDLVRRGESESAVAISGDVELAFAGGIAGPAFTLTADRMDATLRPRQDSADPPDAATDGPADLERLELRAVEGAGRVFARGSGRDVECDAFDYDAATGLLVLTARPGRSVSVMSTTAAAPIRAERVRWNLQTDRVEIDSARGEG